MINEKNFTRAGFLALTIGMGVLGYRQIGARADGIPGMNPMTYAGNLEESGGPVMGMRNLRLTIWDDAMSTESSHARCITSAPGTVVNNGRFQVVLDNACTGAVRGSPDLWLEVEVNGGSLGRTKISAVPFAVEAGRAADLTPAARNTLVPAGSIMAFGGPAAPDGWLLCDGRTVSRSTYAGLFTAIGTSHGGGDGASTFNLPDLRGRFMRGADLGVGRDPDRTGRIAANPGGNIGDTVGTLEAFATAPAVNAFGIATAGAHTHTIVGVGDHAHEQNVTANFGTGGRGNRVDFNADGAGANQYPQGAATGGAGAHTHSEMPAGDHTHTITGGDRETRPTNIAVNYIIKF